MKKNAFLTFIFACIPGAGQMYYGYMKRGTSLLVYFCLFIMLGCHHFPAGGGRRRGVYVQLF